MKKFKPLITLKLTTKKLSQRQLLVESSRTIKVKELYGKNIVFT